MAKQQLYHQTNATKRPSSLFGNAASGQVDYDLPYSHYAIIFVDNEGELNVDSSPSVRDQISSVITFKACQNFLTTLGRNYDFRDPYASAYPCGFKRRRRNTLDSVTNYCPDDDSGTGSSDDDDFPPCNNETVPLRIGNETDIINYYKSTLKHFKQLNCRMLAKEFIKVIEPGKQVRHPYNGGKPPAGSALGSTGDPEKTKPEWWPLSVMHREPDHLRKEYRIELLIHIIRKLGRYGINADKLREVARDTKRKMKPHSHVDIILEILRVRKMEERYERGEIDSDTLVHVIDRELSSKNDEVDGSVGGTDGPSATDGEAGHIEEGLLTPSPSMEQPAGPPTTPVDGMGMPAHSLPGNSALLEPLTFESQQGHAFYATSPAYTASFSQGMQSTPMVADITRTHNVPVSNYQSQSLFPTSTPNQQCGGLLGPHDVWRAPSFPGNIFSPVDNSSPPSSGPLSQPSIPYSVSMERTAPLHVMRSHGQSPADSVCLSPSFDTSSRVTCTFCYPSR